MPDNNITLYFPNRSLEDAHDIERIKDIGHIKEYKADEFIYRMGDTSTDAYFILEGTVENICSYENGKEILIDVHGPGNYFGYAAAIEDQPRTVSALAIETVRAVKIDRETFIDKCLADKQLSLFLMRKMADKLRHLTIRLSNSACLSPKELIIRDLLQRYIDEARPATVIVPTRRLWAAYLGITRETLSRILSELQHDRTVEFLNKTEIHIHDFEALSDYAEQDSDFYKGTIS